MKTIQNFLNNQLTNEFSAKVLGGGETSTVTTQGNDPKKFENLTIKIEVTGIANKALVTAGGGSTSTTITTGPCTTNGSTVTCPTTTN